MTNGGGGMPAFKGVLQDADIQNVAVLRLWLNRGK